MSDGKLVNFCSRNNERSTTVMYVLDYEFQVSIRFCERTVRSSKISLNEKLLDNMIHDRESVFGYFSQFVQVIK